MNLLETILLILTSISLIEFIVTTVLCLLVDYEDKKSIGLKYTMIFLVVSGLTMIIYKFMD